VKKILVVLAAVVSIVVVRKRRGKQADNVWRDATGR
jgi:hypothetical protein